VLCVFLEKRGNQWVDAVIKRSVLRGEKPLYPAKSLEGRCLQRLEASETPLGAASGSPPPQSVHYDEHDHQETVQYKPYIVADSEIIYECKMTQKNTGATQKARVKVSMDNVYTDEYPDGIITYLYFTNVDQQNRNINPVSE
jgi:hypothetical protein